MDARRAVVAASRDAGPPDAVFVSAGGEFVAHVFVLGGDTSSAAAIAATIASVVRNMDLASRREEPASLQSIEATYCTYNALSRVDVCVAATLPGGVRTLAIGDSGCELCLDEELWEETALCGISRALLYGDLVDDGGPLFCGSDVLPGLRRIPVLPNAVSQLRFLEASARVLNCAVDSNAPSVALDTHFVVRAVLRFFVDAARTHEAAGYFARFGSSYGPRSAARLQIDAVSARCYALAGNEPRAFALLCDSLSGDEVYKCNTSEEASKTTVLEDEMKIVRLDSARSENNETCGALFAEACETAPPFDVQDGTASTGRSAILSFDNPTGQIQKPSLRDPLKHLANDSTALNGKECESGLSMRKVSAEDMRPLLVGQAELLLGRVSEGHFVSESLLISCRVAALSPLDAAVWLLHARVSALAGDLEGALVALNNVSEDASVCGLDSRGLPAERQCLDSAGRPFFQSAVLSPQPIPADQCASRRSSAVGRLIARLHSSSTMVSDAHSSTASLLETSDIERTERRLAHVCVRPAVSQALDVLALMVHRHGWQRLLDARAAVFLLEDGARSDARVCEPWLDALLSVLYDVLRVTEDVAAVPPMIMAPSEALSAASILRRLGDEAAAVRLLRHAAEQRGAPQWIRRRAWSILLDIYSTDGRIAHALLACDGIVSALSGDSLTSECGLGLVAPALRRMCAEHGAGRMGAALRAITVSRSLLSRIEAIMSSTVAPT